MFPKLLKRHVPFGKWHKHSFTVFQGFSLSAPRYTIEFFKIFPNTKKKNPKCNLLSFFKFTGKHSPLEKYLKAENFS